MINQYIHVFVQLVASRRALGHGVGYSHVGCQVEFIKNAQNPLERVTDFRGYVRELASNATNLFGVSLSSSLAIL